MTAVSFVPVRDALVLAAGNGDSFHDGSRQSKLLMRAIDIGPADWYDIYTVADLQHAESLLGERAETA